MNVIDHYLSEIARWLPTSKADVIDEIRDEILSQIDDRAAEIRRPLSEAEVVQLLRDYGSPMSVASSYGDRRGIISAELLPAYYLVLGIAITATIAIVVLADTFRAITFDSVAIFWKSMAENWESPIWTLGVVTLVFLAYDRLPKNARRPWTPPRAAIFRPSELVTDVGVAIDFTANVTVLVFLLWVAPGWGPTSSALWHPIVSAGIVSSLVNVITLVMSRSINMALDIRSSGAAAAAAINLWGLSDALRSVASWNVGLRALLGLFAIFVTISLVASVWKVVSRTRRLNASMHQA